MRAAEDVKILYDGTVRNSANNIVQFVYGDDNYDPTKLEKVTMKNSIISNLSKASDTCHCFSVDSYMLFLQ